MPKKALDVMTESMLYTMMALCSRPRCGTEIADFVDELTGGRLQPGPGTLYTILSKFLEVGYIRETAVEGRRRTYEATDEGIRAYEQELARLRQCIADAEAAAGFVPQKEREGNESGKNVISPAPVPVL